jgi:DNA polymerase
LGDLDAKVLVVGQDWGDVAGFVATKGKDTSTNPTNRRLRKLLSLVGFLVPDVLEGSTESGVFLTNAVLCLKAGGLQAPVSAKWFENCGRAFLKPLIELIRPNVVVTLGEHAYVSTVSSFEISRQRFRSVVEAQSIRLFDGCRLVPVYHCGSRIWNTHRKEPDQYRDWDRVKQALAHRQGDIIP